MTINDDGGYFSKYVCGNALSNKNKINTKSVTLRPSLHMLRYLKLYVYNFYIINAKSFKL